MTDQDSDDADGTGGQSTLDRLGELRSSGGGRLRDRLVPGVVQQSFLAKMLVGIAVVLVLSGATAGYFYLGISNDLDNQVDRQVEATAGLHEDVYSDWFRGVRIESENTADLSVLQKDNTRDISAALLLEATDPISNYHYVSTETGEVLASSSSTAEGENMFDRGFDRTLLNEQEFFSPGAYTSPAGGEVIALGQQVRLKDAVLIAEIEHGSAAPTLEQPIEGATTNVLTREGSVLIGSAPDAELPGSFSGETQVRTSDDEIVAYRQIESTPNLVVATRTPKEAAFTLKDDVVQSFVATILLTFLILLGVALVGGRSEPTTSTRSSTARLRWVTAT